MNKNLFKMSVRMWTYLLLTVTAIFTISAGAAAQNLKTRNVEKTEKKEITFLPQPGQLTKQSFEPRTYRTITVINQNPTPSDVDFMAFDSNGKLVGVETVTVNSGESSKIDLENLFPKLALNELSRVETQTTVRAPDWDPNSFKSGPGSENAYQLPVGFFSQRQSPWNAYQIGFCNDTIHNLGCAITSIAMAMTPVVVNLDPGVLNTYLKNYGGYPPNDCIVYWDIADEIDGPGGFQYYGQSTVGTAANMKSLIDSGKFSVIKSTRFYSHYAVVIGYKNNGTVLSDFYYLDPWDTTATFRYIGDYSWTGSSSKIHRYK